MSGAIVLLNIAGAVALLLWAVRMVRTGVDRAFRSTLRHVLNHTLQSRLHAVAVGLVMAIGLQGSTAVALLVTGTLASGLMPAPLALSMLLGADLGSALVVQILSFDLTILIPALLLVGVTLFLSSERRSARQAGRIVIGIALLLIALGMIGLASGPLQESTTFAFVVTGLSADPLTSFLLAALITWLIHSGVAALLLVVALTAHNVVPVDLALVFVFGINMGSGVVAALLTRGHASQVRRVPLSNLGLRGLMATAALVGLSFVDVAGLTAGLDPVTTVVGTHILFNVALVVLGLPLVGPVLRLADRLLPDRPHEEEDADSGELAHRSSLDPEAIDQPQQAIPNAVREILIMSTTVSAMLQGSMDVFQNASRGSADNIKGLDDRVDLQHAKIKHYLTHVGRRKLTKSEARRCAELMSFCIRLEQAADIIVKNLMSLAHKKSAAKLEFSKEGWRELLDLHECVSDNLQLALNVLVTADAGSARLLFEGKQRVRNLEQESIAHHIERLKKGAAKSLRTSEIHLDVMRDLVQINALLTSVAYPILEKSGELLDSRLLPVEPEV